MCHARRKENTIDRTIDSIRDWYSWDIIICAEPWTDKINKEWIIWKQNKTKKWCFINHDNLLKTLLREKKKRIIMLQDDFIYHKDCWKIIEECIEKDIKIGYYCLYTNEVYRGSIKNKWRNKLPIKYESAFQVSYLIRSDVAERVCTHPFYLNHLKNYKPNKQVDACISEVLHQLWLPMYYHNPSLSIHIWHSSSIIWHAHRYEDNFNSF